MTKNTMIKIIYLMMFLPFLSSCDKNHKIENDYVITSIPEDYHDVTDKSKNDILYVVKFQNFNDKANNGGLQSILSIDNIQDLTILPNSQTVKEFTPIEILTSRLKIIEEETRNPDFGWKNFQIMEQPKEINFKGYKAAESTFTVTEKYQGQTIDRKIKRMVVFVKNDLWNIVIAPRETSTYNDELKEFENILNNMKIK